MSAEKESYRCQERGSSRNRRDVRRKGTLESANDVFKPPPSKRKEIAIKKSSRALKKKGRPAACRWANFDVRPRKEE